MDTWRIESRRELSLRVCLGCSHTQVLGCPPVGKGKLDSGEKLDSGDVDGVFVERVSLDKSLCSKILCFALSIVR